MGGGGGEEVLGGFGGFQGGFRGVLRGVLGLPASWAGRWRGGLSASGGSPASEPANLGRKKEILGVFGGFWGGVEGGGWKSGEMEPKLQLGWMGKLGSSNREQEAKG